MFNVTHRVGALTNFGRASSKDVGGVEFGVHGVCLTRINHKEYLVVSVA